MSLSLDFRCDISELTSQVNALAMAFSLVVTSPSYGPKCIPGQTIGP